MARQRMIKPEFWSSEQIVECSTNARLLFIGLWNFCDDGGCHPASVARLKMEVFPADSFTLDDIRGWIDELVQNHLIEPYSFEGKDFWHVTGWHHQKIEHPKYIHPRSKEFGEASTIVRRGVADHSLVTEVKLNKDNINTGSGAFSSLTEDCLRNTARMVAWHIEQSGKRRPVIGQSEAERLRVIAAAEHALAKGHNPPALFAEIVSKKLWGHITQDAEDRGAQRIKAWQSHGPPKPTTAEAEELAKKLSLSHQP